MKFLVVFVALVAVCSAFMPAQVRSGRTALMASTVSMESVKILREKSGAGMMDCKKALTESDGDVEGAVDWLRKKGLAAVAKKSGRATSSGLVGVTSSADGKAAAVVEINCETDFVARNDNFQASIIKVGEIAAGLDGVDRDSLLAAEYGGESATVTDEMTRLVATIGENMNLRRAARISVNNGVVTTYMHSATKPGLGKIGVAVALESTSTNAEQLAELGKKLSLHIAAQAPEALNRDQVDATKLQREKDVLVDQAKATGKPEAAIEKMVEGRIRKYYEEVVLMEQPFVMDGKVKVNELVKQAAKEMDAAVEVTGFIRFALGDGVKKEEEE